MTAYRPPTTAYPALGPLAEAAPAVPSSAGCVAFPARHASVATFGVRLHGCRSSHAHDLARGTPLLLPVTWMLDVLMVIIESGRNE